MSILCRPSRFYNKVMKKLENAAGNSVFKYLFLKRIILSSKISLLFPYKKTYLLKSKFLQVFLIFRYKHYRISRYTNRVNFCNTITPMIDSTITRTF